MATTLYGWDARASPRPNACATSGAADDRLAGLDFLRLIAVVGLVWFHTHAPGHRVAFSGLTMLLVTSVALPAMKSDGRSLAGSMARRARRLLVPWAFWSMVYVALDFSIYLFRSKPTFARYHINMFVTGPAIHLWYMPFAFLASAVAIVVGRLLLPLPRWASISGCVAVGVLMLVAIGPLPGLSSPLDQWRFGSIALPIGLAVGLALRRDRGESSRVGLVAIAAALMLTAIALGPFDSSGRAMSYGIGVPVLCAAMLFAFRMPERFTALTTLGMGIYVLHPLVSSQLIGRIVPILHAGLAVEAILVTVATALLTLALLKTPCRRFL